MNPSATGDRTEAFTGLLQELRDRPSGTSGEWLALKIALRSRGITPEQTRGLWPRVLRLPRFDPRAVPWILGEGEVQ